MNFKKKVNPKNTEKKQQKEDVLKNSYNLIEGRERVLNAFKSKIFPIEIKSTGFSDKVLDHSNLKISTLKQILEKLPIALAQGKADNRSENLLNEIRQTIDSLYWAKVITKKSILQYNELNKGIIQKWILYLWILRIVKQRILIDCHPTLQIK